MKEPFHVRLKRLREAKGWTLHHLSKKSRLSEPAITELEADSRRVPAWGEVVKLASALGTNPVYLASGVGDADPFRIPHGHVAETTYSRNV